MWISPPKAHTTPVRFLLSVSRPYAAAAMLSSVATLAAGALETGGSYIFKRIVDIIATGGASHAGDAWNLGLVYITCFLLLPLALWRVSGFAGMRWVTGIRATTTDALTSYVTKHSSEYFYKRFAGALGSKIGNTSQSAASLVEKFLWSQLILIVTLVTSFALAFSASAMLGWLFVAWLAVTAPVSILLARKMMSASALVQKEDTRVRASVIDLITNIGAMHDFARRTYELASLKPLALARRNAGVKNWTLGETNRIASNTIQLFFVSGIIFYSIHAWSTGASTPGDIVLAFALVTTLGFRMEELGRNINDFAQNYGEVSEGIDDLLNPYDVEDAPDAKSLLVDKGSIRFDHVTFEYAEGSREVLSDFSLSIPAGQKVGLVGRSGAGKSTLVKLLLRHYDVSGGAILIDGQKITDVELESLRAAISVVPQEALLFHRTIKENIAYGKLGATEEEVAEAARLAHADEFIKNIPMRYETMVGERGIKLSGGERQRIVLARAILKPAKILVLDEATSALDSESEAAIQEALATLMDGKTVLAIAHRLSTLRQMDRILVLDGGKIIEDGSHTELIKKKGVYAELWSRQSGGYLQDEE